MTKIVELTDESNLVTELAYTLKGKNKKVGVIFTNYDKNNLEFLERSAQGFVKYLVKEDSIEMVTSRIGIGDKYLKVNGDLKGQEIPKESIEYSALCKKLEEAEK